VTDLGYDCAVGIDDADENPYDFAVQGTGTALSPPVPGLSTTGMVVLGLFVAGSALRIATRKRGRHV
jgi:hypothetical protein